MSPGDAPPEPDAGVVEARVQEAIDFELEKRAWLRTIAPLLALRSHESDPSGRVQLAFDLMHIAACERVSRILRSDQSEEPTV